MGKTYSTTFTQANGAPAQITDGPAWETISGVAPTVVSNELSFTTAGSSNPIFGVTAGTGNVDASMRADHVYGNALYVRVADANNWIRAKVYSEYDSYQYYQTEYRHTNWGTEYEYRAIEYRDYYQPQVRETYWRNAVREYEYSYQTTVSAGCTYSSWSGWSNCGFSETGCRDGPQATNATEYDTNSGASCGAAIKEYRVIQTNNTGCSGGRYHYQQQCRTRSVTYHPPQTTTNYTWAQSSPGSGYTATGNSRVVALDSYYWAVTKNSADDLDWGSYREVDSGSVYYKIGTSSTTKTTTANGTYDDYLYTQAYDTVANYWATSARDSSDTATGQSRQYAISYYWDTNPGTAYDQTRQGGPYTGYNYYYGYVALEKCVAGTITQLGSYYSGSSTGQVVRIRALGSSLQVYYGGTLRISATDSTHATATKVGVGGAYSYYNQTNARVDDFSYTTLSSIKVRNAANTAWIDVTLPKVRVGSAWVETDLKVK